MAAGRRKADAGRVALGSRLDGERVAEVNWSLVGEHNMHNGLMAIAAARHVGVKPEDAGRALDEFINARRRLELRGEANGIKVYDDFAHHPTAILATLAALRSKVGGTARILAVLEPRSNTMKLGVSKEDLAPRWARRGVPLSAASYSVAGGGSGGRLYSARVLERRYRYAGGNHRQTCASGRHHSGDEQRRFRRHSSETVGSSGQIVGVYQPAS